MKKRMTLWQRAVAMVLALQMTAAPVAMARATDLLFVSVTGEQAMLTSATTAEGADTGAEPETGTEPDTGAADPTYQLDKDAEQYFVDANASLLNTGEGTNAAYVSNVTVSLSMGMPDGEDLERFYDGGTGEFGSYLYGPEYVSDADSVAQLGWGYRDGVTALSVATDGMNYYFHLPSDKEIGRVPDLEFDGFYIYRDEDLAWWDTKIIKDGLYDGLGNNALFSVAAKEWRWEGQPFADTDKLVEVDPSMVTIDWTSGTDRYDSPVFAPNEKGALVSVPADALVWTKYEDLHEEIVDFYTRYQGSDFTAEDWEEYREVDSAAGIPVIAKWKASSIARFTDFGFTWTDDDGVKSADTTIYTMEADKGGENTAAYEVKEKDVLTALEGSDGEYFIQVTSDVDYLDLTFDSYEPYWDYHKNGAECPVTVKVIRDGVEDEAFGSISSDSGFTSEMLAARTETGQEQVNRPTNPARARWTLPQIKLDSEETEVTKVIEVIVTLTAPDGENTRTVTFHIRKLADPILTKAPGNTPFGMIDRDTAFVWGSDAAQQAANKTSAKSYFETHHQFDTTYFPKDNEHHQGGEIFKGIYTSAMWDKLKVYRYDYESETWSYGETENLDLRSDAIVVYQDTVALDPGVTLTASRGETDIVYHEDITARIAVLTATDELTPDLVGATADANGVTTYTTELDYTGDRETGEHFIIDLRGEKVLPGVYFIEYSYDDWYIDDIVDSGNKAVFSDTSLADNFSRPLIVLPTPGDVDMDGAVTHADALALQTYINSKPNAEDPAVELFLRRVCDVTHDGEVDVYDVAKLEGGFYPEVHKPDNNGSSDYWYIPLPDGGTEVYIRRTWSDLDVSGGVETASLFSRFLALFSTEETKGATISLKYLGVEPGDVLSDGTTVTPTGPWDADPGSKVALGEYDSEENKGKNQGEVFWMGVMLSGVEQSLLNGKSVDSLTLTVTYDDRYVEPAYVVPNGESGWDVVAGKTDMEKWKYSVTRYNLGGLSDGKTLWGEKADYTLTAATAYDLNYTTHYSKVMSDLEQELGAGNEHLRQLTFSVSLTGGRTAVTLKDGCVVALPFRLIKHPFGEDVLQAVELSAGMRELTLVSRTTVGGEVTTATAAYSAQDAIFGDSTQNLRSQTAEADGVTYANVLANIPLGTNNTQYTAELEAWYGVPVTFGYDNKIPQVGNVDQSALPPGLTYNEAWQLTGTPTEANEDGYEFVIGGRLFRLVVHKKPIDCWVNSAVTYYGEEDYRGFSSGNFTFTYDETALYQADVDRAEEKGVALNGNGEELYELFFNKEEGGQSYTAPTFAAKEGAGVVHAKSSAGTYTIETRSVGLLKNYQLNFPASTAKLTILPRPVVADVLGTLYVGEIYLDDNPSMSGAEEGKDLVLSAEVSNTAGAGVFTLAKPENYRFEAGYTGDPLVAGDNLTISYTATWSQVGKDFDQGTTFTLDSGREYRPIRLSNLKLVNDTGASNYVLVQNIPNQNYDVDSDAANTFDFTVESGDSGPEGYSGPYGTVARREVTNIAIRRMPDHFTQGVAYTYGDNLTGTDGLWIHIFKDGGEQHGTFKFGPDLIAEWDLHVNFVDADEVRAEPSEADPYAGTGRNPVTGEDENPYREGLILTHSDHNGRYLCVSVDVRKDDGSLVVIREYSEKPILVNARTLTLTAQKLTRFYGEENTGLTYTYNSSELAWRDRLLLNGVEKETAEELEALMEAIGGEGYYTPPTMTALTSADDPVEVDKFTAAGTACKIQISGAKTADGNYIFSYANGGVAALEILKRRVVVEDLNALGEARVFKEVRLYADTRDITTTKVIQEDNKGGPLELTLDEVDIGAPEKNGNGIIYWNSGTYVTQSALDFPMTGEPILAEDELKLKLTYTATVVPDSGQWLNFGAGYFETADWTGNSKEYPAQIGNLDLTGEAAGNYELVYKNAETAQKRAPANAEYKSAPADDGTGSTVYYVSAKAMVYRRPVDSLVIVGLPAMSYTSGATFNPVNGLKVKVQYSRAYDNRPDINVTSEDVTYGYSGSVGGVLQTTFGGRGFTIGYRKGNSTGTLDHTTELSCVKHHGAEIFVAGTNSVGAPIQSEPAETKLTVTPRTLTLTINDIHRFYGEPNDSSVTVLAGTLDQLEGAQGFTFSFDESQLSPADRATLAREGLTGKDGAKALEALGLNFKGPTYYTEAGPDSGASDEGYSITAVTDGSLDNYTLNWVDGAVYVYPRVVRVDHFENNEDWPIYTIYSDMNIESLTTEIRRVAEVYRTENDEAVMYRRERVFFGMPIEGASVNGWTQEAVNGKSYWMPLTETAIYGYDPEDILKGDNLTIRATVSYYSEDGKQITDIPEGAESATYTVRLTDFSIVPGSENSQNYKLYNSNTSLAKSESKGAVALRKLVSIRVVRAPNKMEYTYGESLSLAGLAVEITYGMLGTSFDTVREKVTVSYVGPDDFKSYGLYVDYSDKDTVEDKGSDSANGAYWREIIAEWRSADTGDHVTIAPSHDDSTFAHNGKYLIISGQLHEKHTPVTPVIVSEVFGSGASITYGKPIPVKVNPLKLTFTLSAQDKTYDGNTTAAGTLTLTNVVDLTGYIDAYNTNGITDVVFVRTGADYESPEGDIADHRIYGVFKAHVADKGYTFTTGSYEPNRPWPLGANGTIQWVDGYQGLLGKDGYLTFKFVDHNVRYVDGDYQAAVDAVGESIDYWTTGQAANTPGGTWDTFGTVAAMPVEVTGMVLDGPDAANYTWAWEEDWAWTKDNARRVGETSVLMSTPDIADDGQDAVPFATIHKANRQTIWDSADDRLTPTVAVDRHTNVVQLTWEQDVAKVMELESAKYTGETHFEYALLYVDSATGQLRQWAGNDGAAGWQDTLYFGGEFVDPEVPVNYVPDPDDLPTAEDVAEEDYVFKGQIYRWLDDDGGVWIDDSAYPDGARQLGYDLLASERTGLPRDTVFWPMVRVSETHNYLSSPVLSGDGSLTARHIDDWMKAVAAYDANPTDANLALVESAADAVIEQLTDTETAARKAADDEVAEVKRLAAEGDWPEDNIWTDPAPTAAVKTFTERIDVISVEETESFDETDETEYRVPTLEAVWFTDLMDYPEEGYMDVVLRNNEPTRYYGYYWDRWMSAELEFDEEAPIDLSGPIHGIPVEYDDEDGNGVEATITVNENGTLKLYVETTGGGAVPIRDFFVEPSYIVARIGDEPIELTVTFIPEKATHTRLNWLTSDPAVATVKHGIVTIVGPGTATITAVTQNGLRREIQVLVLTAEQLWGGIFNWSYTDAWFDREKDGLFHPLREMTRGEVTWMLSKLYVPSETWTRSGPSYFSDLTGEEYYYDAAILLGSEGVILGVPGGEFQGERTITRGEFAAMMARMLDLPMPDPLNSKAIYSDVEVGGHWAWAYIHAMSAVGAMHGVGDGQFAPDAILTRAEAATVIARLLHKQIDTEQKDWWVPLDVSEPDWFYWYVVRAVNDIGAVSDLVE